MTVRVPADPVCLDLPDHELCQGDPPPPPATGGQEPGTSRISLLPCFGLATILHGLILVLGLTLVVSSELPNSVISISLLPGLGDSAPPPGSGQGFGDPFEPASPPAAEPVKTEALAPEPGKPRPVKPNPKKIGSRGAAGCVQGLGKARPASSPCGSDLRCIG